MGNEEAFHSSLCLCDIPVVQPQISTVYALIPRETRTTWSFQFTLLVSLLLIGIRYVFGQAGDTQHSLLFSLEQVCLPGSPGFSGLLSHRMSSSQDLVVRHAQTQQAAAQVQTRTLVPLVIASKCSVILTQDSDQLFRKGGQNEAGGINSRNSFPSEKEGLLIEAC